jgi:hypothetical protein
MLANLSGKILHMAFHIMLRSLCLPTRPVSVKSINETNAIKILEGRRNYIFGGLEANV